MDKVKNHIDKVRYRNEGDDFHELWATRRILHLIDPRDDLVAVSIEGISKNEDSGTNAGLLSVDMTEYYGNEDIKQSRKIIYSQLKHSTTDSQKDWSASGLGEVIEAFADRFKNLVKKHGIETIRNKVSFQFVSNRHISSNVEVAIRAAIEKKEAVLEGHAANAFKTLKEKYGSDDEHFSDFLRLLVLSGRQKDHSEQETGLSQDVCRLMAYGDINIRLRLKNLVHERTLPKYRDDPTIRIENLLAALDIVHLEQLLPAPPRFEFKSKIFPREQEADIAKCILDTKFPVVIHASGGVGKSVFATRLPGLMPKGSACVIFDGFAGGEYKIDRVPRHLPRYGLVQLANELAGKGLCDPLLPSNAQLDAYLMAFRLRLRQAVEVVRAKTPGAVVLVVLDAADNSEMAASDRHDRSFIRGLLQELPPEGCRLVFLARTERLPLLSLPENYCNINLLPFSQNESACHLRLVYPKADDVAVQRFHELTAQNPRVQSYELVQAGSFSELLANLGPNVREVDDVIAGQVRKALGHIRQHSTNEKDIDRLCLALALLPPMVPIQVLAKAASVPSEAVRSFVSDLGHPLIIRDDAVQFRDEPVETWFRKEFDTDVADFRRLADTLSSLAEADSYVAVTLPRILYRAGRYEELVTLALRNDGPDEESVIARRDIILRRVQYAMKAMQREGRVKDVMKLLLRAAEEVASKKRQADFLIKNGGLVAVLTESGILPDLVFRKHSDCWAGVNLVHRAAILASHSQYRAEAYGFYRQAQIWLNEWSHLSQKEREQQPIAEEDIANFVLTAFHLSGPQDSLEELRCWKPKKLLFDVGRIVFKNLIDFNGEKVVEEFIKVAQSEVRLLLAAAIELDAVGKFLPREIAVAAAKILLRLKRKIFDSSLNDNTIIEMAILATVEALVFHYHSSIGLELLECFLPELPYYLPVAHEYKVDKRILIIKAYALRACIKSEPLTAEELFLATFKKENRYDQNRQDLMRLMTCYSTLLPWFQVRAKVIMGQLNTQNINDGIKALSKGKGNNYEQRSPELFDLAQIVAQTWLSALVIGEAASEDTVRILVEWLDSSKNFVYTRTWTYLSRLATHCGKSPGMALEMAAKAAKIVEGEHMTAGDSAEIFADLAKAVLPVSREEAQAYLDRGFEILDRLDDNARDNLNLLSIMAKKIGFEFAAESKEAYRLSRVAELINAYDDHKFPWFDVAVALTELCPPSSLAIISRWRDRGKGWLGETLPSVLKRLVEKGKISPGIIMALNVLNPNWFLGEVIKSILENERENHLRQTIMEMLERDIEIDENIDTARNVSNTLRLLGIKSDRLEKMLPPPENLNIDKSQNLSLHVTETARNENDWIKIFGKGVFLTIEEVAQAVRALHKASHYYPGQEFFKKMREKVPVSHRSDHLKAIASCSEFDVHLILYALKEALEEWQQFSAVKKAVPEIVQELLNSRSVDFLCSSYSLNSHISDLASLSLKSKHHVLNTLLEAAVEHIDGIPANSYNGPHFLNQ